jgi:hypothetical protein
LREADLKMDRKTLGSFKVNGKTFSILEPTLGQLIRHTNESRGIAKEIEALRSEEKFEDISNIQNAWLMNEVTIFIPSMKEEDVGEMTPSQRNLVLNCIFGIEETLEEVSTEADAKKKPRKRPSPGEKS